MKIGQVGLGEAALDVVELDRLAACIELEERDRSLRHARQLGNILDLHRVYATAGMALSTPAYLALLLQCSETRATSLLCDAQVLQRLGAVEDMRQGLVTVEQARVVVDLLGVLPDDALAASLWERLRERLLADQAQEIVRPPARLRELLKGWLIAADPEGFAARRRAAAEADADVELWKRDDGLADLAGRGLPVSDAQACLDRIEELAQPTGPDDTRSAGQRRRDAYRDLLLGRAWLPFEEATGEVLADAGCCPTGSAAPCGAQIFVHTPLQTAAGAITEPAVAAGTAEPAGATKPAGPAGATKPAGPAGAAGAAEPAEPAQLVGHGPVDPAQLADLLANAPVLHRVWVDPQTGVPVTVDERVWTPGRDPEALRTALAEMRTASPPGQRHPVSPQDHLPDQPVIQADSSPGLRVLTRPHLADPGRYVPPRRLKQLLRVRAPRCEWPGCGRRSSRAVAAGCDLDHDLAWPHGPTCACNLGPLCRRHHRIKQLGWTKRRRSDGSVSWTDQTGRSWTSPGQGFGPSVPGWVEVSAGVGELAA